MGNKLFFICPECCIEHSIQRSYGSDAMFMTALGSVFNFGDSGYTEALADLLERESISEIYIVNEPSCRFIGSALAMEKASDTFAEIVLRDLWMDNHATFMKGNSSILEQRKHLAELNFRRQVDTIYSNEFLSKAIIQNEIVIKGLISIKQLNQTIEVTHNPYHFKNEL